MISLPLILILPFIVAGFFAGMFPRAGKTLGLLSFLFSLSASVHILVSEVTDSWFFMPPFGVHLLMDGRAAWLLLTNAIVSLGVWLYLWHQNLPKVNRAILIILHGSVNAAFLCHDFISLYVALEVIGISAFILIASPNTIKTAWVAMRYLIIGNTAMLFYLMGVVLIYQAHHTLSFDALSGASSEALTLIVSALMIKGGVFISGLWLPLTHGESASPISALLSGVVVKTGVFPLLKMAEIQPELEPVLRVTGVVAVFMGLLYAITSKDLKRMLAFHTISQLGYVLAAPAAGFVFAFSHGIVKAMLFLGGGALPSRSFAVLKKERIPFVHWLILALASLSITGLPFFLGFTAKEITASGLLTWQSLPLSIAGIGTAISFSKFLFLPHDSLSTWFSHGGFKNPGVSRSLSLAAMVLLPALLIGGWLDMDLTKSKAMVKSLLLAIVGWGLYLGVFSKIKWQMPRHPEKLEHIIGVMGLTMIVVFLLITEMP